MKISSVVFLLSFSFWLPGASGQTATPSLRRAPEMSAWQVTYSSKVEVDPAHASSAKTSARIIKTNDIMLIEEWLADGSATKTWKYQGLIVVPIQDSYALKDPSFEPDAGPMFKTDFFELAWIQSKDFKGEVVKGKQKLWHFSQAERPGSYALDGTQIEAARAESEAWLDIETGLPVMARESIRYWTYEFLAPPDAQLVPPSVISDMVKLYLKYQDPTFLPR